MQQKKKSKQANKQTNMKQTEVKKKKKNWVQIHMTVTGLPGGGSTHFGKSRQMRVHSHSEKNIYKSIFYI